MSPRFATFDTAHYTVVGGRLYQEDAVIPRNVIHEIQYKDIRYAAVFDGHSGDRVALQLAGLFPAALETHVLGKLEKLLSTKNNASTVRMAVTPWLKLAFAEANDALEEADRCGSTVALAIVTPQYVIFASVGDSYAALLDADSGAVLMTSISHAAYVNDRETERIEKIGVHIEPHMTRDHVNGGFATSHYVHDDKTGLCLGMTRAMGDKDMRFVIAVPDVQVFEVTPLAAAAASSDADADAGRRLCVLLASDGLTDAYTEKRPKKDDDIYMFWVPHVDHERLCEDCAAVQCKPDDLVKRAVQRPAWNRDNTTAQTLLFTVRDFA